MDETDWETYLNKLSDQQTGDRAKFADLIEPLPITGKKKKGNKGSSLKAELQRSQRQASDLQFLVKQADVELAEKVYSLRDSRSELEKQSKKIEEITLESRQKLRLGAHQMSVMTEELTSSLDDVQLENQRMKAELQSMTDALQLFDTLEVEEHNRELREQVRSMCHQQLVEKRERNAKDMAQRKTMIELRYKLEREFRNSLKGAEEKVRQEVFEKLSADSKTAIAQRDELTNYLYQMVDDVDVVNQRFKSMESDKQRLALEHGVTEDLSNEQTKKLVTLKQQLKNYEESNDDLAIRLAASESRASTAEAALEQLRAKRQLEQFQAQNAGEGQDVPTAAAIAMHSTAAAPLPMPPETPLELPAASPRHSAIGTPRSSPRSSVFTTQSVDLEDAGELAARIQELESKYSDMKREKERWHNRALKLEQINTNLRSHLSKCGEPPAPDEILNDGMDYKSIWSTTFTQPKRAIAVATPTTPAESDAGFRRPPSAHAAGSRPSSSRPSSSRPSSTSASRPSSSRPSISRPSSSRSRPSSSRPGSGARQMITQLEMRDHSEAQKLQRPGSAAQIFQGGSEKPQALHATSKNNSRQTHTFAITGSSFTKPGAPFTQAQALSNFPIVPS
ncbi:hypothetical protein CYMTET_28513 [Cymbomonas tetramitiformis]|uniref:Uncharacterized protein n=1 Tax=Cymbomonas tetramitiformis TaxID=36881 RepID=A0AAE0FMN2_9CHLO|nr:hypothetical protein CYMTET_28513 [Cymbomonas tetramitiformis]